MSTGSSGAEELSEALLTLCKSPTLTLEGLLEFIGHYGVTPYDNSEDINNSFFIEACGNEAVDESIIQCLLEYFPRAINAVEEEGWTPFHAACSNKNVTLGVIKRLIAASENGNNHGQSPLLCGKTERGSLPLHYLCGNDNVNEKATMDILMLLLEKYPESIRQVNNDGLLPIHFASGYRSPQFCQVLLDSYPESVRVQSADFKALPLHFACRYNTLPTVEYLYKLYPDAVHQTAQQGEMYPIHYTILNDTGRDTESALEIIQFLLDCDPKVKLQKNEGQSLLHYLCFEYDDDDDTDIEEVLQFIDAIYDAHPEAIEDDLLLSDIDHFKQQARAFINGELVHARLANDHRQMTTVDENEQLPLHHAMRNNVRLGSIKLLLNGNPDAIQHADSNGALPLHLACQYHHSPNVVQYLADLDPTTLKDVDNAGNSALHYECREARYDVIAMLLESNGNDSVSVSTRNENGKLPIEVLYESNKVIDRESVEYIDCVFRLLKAYPLALMSFNSHSKDSASTASSSSSLIGMKRKFGDAS